MPRLTTLMVLKALHERWLNRRTAPYWTAAMPAATLHEGKRHEVNFTYLYCNN